jgi:hypothetical protein
MGVRGFLRDVFSDGGDRGGYDEVTVHRAREEDWMAEEARQDDARAAEARRREDDWAAEQQRRGDEAYYDDYREELGW